MVYPFLHTLILESCTLGIVHTPAFFYTALPSPPHFNHLYQSPVCKTGVSLWGQKAALKQVCMILSALPVSTLCEYG